MNDRPRLIEVAFPLKQASLDSVHEKNVRHGHISTLHIWPARRPLAACRAALIATLLPDPGNAEERKLILERLGGKVVEVTRRKRMPSGKIEEVVAEETVGGILHWGRESGPDLDWFRAKIREAYGGRAPKVLDPFAGGGAIPLEAMRLGCEATAIDINPVAWFILKCTLEYPQSLAGQKRPLPAFVLRDREFMEEFFKAQGLKGATLRTQLEKLGLGEHPERQFPELAADSVPLEADLAWHVRAWGRWVLERARTDLERFYPVVDGKPTVAYLWARAVKCKHCRATLPLLKTRWLCKKDNKRVLLTTQPNVDKTGVVFGIQAGAPIVGANAAQRREHDKRAGAGTMSRSRVTCPCCEGVMTSEDLRLEAAAGGLGAVMVTVATKATSGIEYRMPAELDVNALDEAASELSHVFSAVPLGLPSEPVPRGASRTGGGSPFTIHMYGMDQWSKMFTSRQLVALGVFLQHTRASYDVMRSAGYGEDWVEAITAYLACVFSRTADYMASLCVWEHGAEEVKHVFMRWALPITWDFAEANPVAPVERFYVGGLNSAGLVVSAVCAALRHGVPRPQVINRSAIDGGDETVDIVFTDPPYYDAIPYSDLMDYFYVWLRRLLMGQSLKTQAALQGTLSPKWDHDANNGELIDDASRFNGNAEDSKKAYEDGMQSAFVSAARRLAADGRMVVVFANKNPSAWESLAASIIRAGFTVTGSWPIATEMPGGLRNLNRASLASSVWLVCKKRPETARPGWDNRVLDAMREKITTRLRDFWDAGIRGPDFVWAATGPALEEYSKHPIVKKADEPGQIMTVSEFLGHVRRIVVEFVVGRVLTSPPPSAPPLHAVERGPGGEVDVSGLDDVTTYYLLHRHDFGMDDAPIGACILYAISCGLSDRALADQYDLLARTGGQEPSDEDEAEEAEGEIEEGSGSKVRLKQWNQRKRRGMGYEAIGGRSVPLIDQIHRLMQLWKAGSVGEVDEYLDSRGLRRNALFHQLLQALIELAGAGSDERSLLESISNYLNGSALKRQARLEGM